MCKKWFNVQKQLWKQIRKKCIIICLGILLTVLPNIIAPLVHVNLAQFIPGNTVVLADQDENGRAG